MGGDLPLAKTRPPAASGLSGAIRSEGHVDVFEDVSGQVIPQVFTRLAVAASGFAASRRKASTATSSIPISSALPVLKLARSVHWRFPRPCSRTPSSGLSSSDLGA